MSEKGESPTKYNSDNEYFKFNKDGYLQKVPKKNGEKTLRIMVYNANN